MNQPIYKYIVLYTSIISILISFQVDSDKNGGDTATKFYLMLCICYYIIKKMKAMEIKGNV